MGLKCKLCVLIRLVSWLTIHLSKSTYSKLIIRIYPNKWMLSFWYRDPYIFLISSQNLFTLHTDYNLNHISNLQLIGLLEYLLKKHNSIFSSRVFLVVGYKLHTCAWKLRCVPGITELFVNTIFEVILLMFFGIVIFFTYCKIWFKTQYLMFSGHHWRVIRISDCSI